MSFRLVVQNSIADDPGVRKEVYLMEMVCRCRA